MIHADSITRADSRLHCWEVIRQAGREAAERITTPPDGPFEAVSAGRAHTCGIRPNGTLTCWGFGDTRGKPPEGSSLRELDFDQAVPPEGTFDEVAAGVRHTCGVRTDGRVECWGIGTDENVQEGPNGEDFPWDRDQSLPPPGRFVDVSAGGTHSCAVRAKSGDVVCWGSFRKSDDASTGDVGIGADAGARVGD